MDYFDFELEIGVGRGRRYPVRVLRSPDGEAESVMRFPFDTLALNNHLLQLQLALERSGRVGATRSLTWEEQSVREFGRALFEALFSGDILARYVGSRRGADAQGKGLRLKLRIRSPELAALPWEFLYDPAEADYICLSRWTPLVRYPEIAQPFTPFPVTAPLRILAMIANPTDQDQLDVDRERQRLREAVASLEALGMLQLEWCEGQTWRDLQKAMWRGPWHIFHFIGHGAFDRKLDEGIIGLADDQGRTAPLRSTHLGRLLRDHRSLHLVILNSCEGAQGSSLDVFSSTAATLVRTGLPAVLAMQYEISDLAAIAFAHAFYEAVAYGMSIDEAVSVARTAVSIEIDRTVEWGTPVLYMRAPDGRLFDVAVPSSIPATPSVVARIEQTEQDRAAAENGELKPVVPDELPHSAFDTARPEHETDTGDEPVAAQPDVSPTQPDLDEAARREALELIRADGRRAFEAGDWVEAIRRLEAAAEMDPDDVDTASLLDVARQRRDAHDRPVSQPAATAPVVDSHSLIEPQPASAVSHIADNVAPPAVPRQPSPRAVRVRPPRQYLVAGGIALALIVAGIGGFLAFGRGGGDGSSSDGGVRRTGAELIAQTVGRPAIGSLLGTPLAEPQSVRIPFLSFERGLMVSLDGVLDDGGILAAVESPDASRVGTATCYESTGDGAAGAELPTPDSEGHYPAAEPFAAVLQQAPGLRDAIGQAEWSEPGTRAVLQRFERGIIIVPEDTYRTWVFYGDLKPGSTNPWESFANDDTAKIDAQILKDIERVRGQEDVRAALGNPRTDAQLAEMRYQQFQFGVMLNTDFLASIDPEARGSVVALVTELADDYGPWDTYNISDALAAENPTPLGTPAAGTYVALPPFDAILRANPSLAEQIGDSVDSDVGDEGAWQLFDHGLIVYLSGTYRTWVLILASDSDTHGTWDSFTR
ncbi:MAG TPA: CHAT domain-containing protein [Thermomicrobiales bacterium]|nr:CHAT domain-containing protein [Thermomicrobiales bacterium]